MMKKEKIEEKVLTEEELELLETGSTGLNFIEIFKNVFKKLD